MGLCGCPRGLPKQRGPHCSCSRRAASRARWPTLTPGPRGRNQRSLRTKPPMAAPLAGGGRPRGSEKPCPGERKGPLLFFFFYFYFFKGIPLFLFFIYLFILFLFVLGPRFCARAFSMRQAGATLHRGARASHGPPFNLLETSPQEPFKPFSLPLAKSARTLEPGSGARRNHVFPARARPCLGAGGWL